MGRLKPLCSSAFCLQPPTARFRLCGTLCIVVRGAIILRGMRYTDKVVIVTGGSRGIGEGCARVFAEAGAVVVIASRDEGAGEALAAELNARGPEGKAHFVACDVTKYADLEHLVAE